MDERVPELRLGPIATETDKNIALREIEDRINRVIRALNFILEELGYVEPDA